MESRGDGVHGRKLYFGADIGSHNQCAVYINKLDEYRKNVNRKIKTGQVDDLYKSSSRPFEKELEGLYTNFDKAFLKLYPNFVEEFNSLLKPEEFSEIRGVGEIKLEKYGKVFVALIRFVLRLPKDR